jgi:arginase
MQNEITFLINTSEITAGTRGSSLGPGALFAAARKQGSTLFGDFPMIHVPEQNYLLDQPTRFPFAKRIDGLVNTFEAISTAVQQVFSENRFPFIIASDHGSAGGTIAGIKAQFPNKRLGVIWIDAHGDLHSPYTTPSGNMHGMPLSTALNEDNLPCKSNELDSETITFWNALKNCGGIVPKINPEDLCFVAVRDTEAQEDALIERLNIKNFTVAEVRNEGTDSIAERILEKLENCDLIYISFDVDSMDPELTSYGTGTPVADGLTPDEAKNLMLRLLDSPKIACLEVVEINPCLDNKINTMAETTFEIVKPIIQKIQSN